MRRTEILKEKHWWTVSGLQREGDETENQECNKSETKGKKRRKKVAKLKLNQL